MNDKWERELKVAAAAVRNAALACRSVQQGIDAAAMQKKDRSPVTVADFASQAVICRALQEAFEHDPVIGEEDASALRTSDGAGFLSKIVHEVQQVVSGPTSEQDVLGWIDRGGTREYSARFWTLDPVDGTKGFLRKEQYAIALALVVQGRVTVAALACPNLAQSSSQDLGVLFTAVAGAGAWAQPLFEQAAPEPIRISPVQETSQMRFCESVESGHSAHGQSAQVAQALGIELPPLRLDSQAKYGVVARGDAQIYLRLPTRADYREKIWDHAAGSLVVAEAGGTVTDVDGKPLDFTHGGELVRNRGVIVSNGPVHARILEALRRSE